MFVTYYALLSLVIVRLACFRQVRVEPWEICLLLLYSGFAFVSAIFFTRIRFRLPLDFLLMIVGGHFLGRLFQAYDDAGKGGERLPEQPASLATR